MLLRAKQTKSWAKCVLDTLTRACSYSPVRPTSAHCMYVGILICCHLKFSTIGISLCNSVKEYLRTCIMLHNTSFIIYSQLFERFLSEAYACLFRRVYIHSSACIPGCLACQSIPYITSAFLLVKLKSVIITLAQSAFLPAFRLCLTCFKYHCSSVILPFRLSFM